MKDKKIWRKNFEGTGFHYQLLTPAIADLMLFQDKTIKKKALKEIICIYSDDGLEGAYMPLQQLRDSIDSTMRALKEKPNRVESVHSQAEKYCREYFDYVEELKKIDFKAKNDSELLKIYKKLHYYQMMHHGYAALTTWFVDSDGEDLSEYLMGLTEKYCLKVGKKNIAEKFSILTTPTRSSFAMKEEKDFLKIILKIKNSKKFFKLFQEKKKDIIREELEKPNSTIEKKIINHFEKWKWVPYGYTGPEYDLEHYLDVWIEYFQKRHDTQKDLKILQNQNKRNQTKKEKIFKELKINTKDQIIFKIAADIIWLKAFRKDCLFHGLPMMDTLLKEFGRRLGLSLQQMRSIADWELEQVVKTGEFSLHILNTRRKKSVYYQKGDKGEIYIEKEAEEFIKKINFEKIVIKNTSSLKGTCACPGKVKGIVKIINLPEEMEKMEEGNIMVAHTTFPSLVPVMKKASAIVTDDGGITCHAAIVARELKTPCVVGIKIATRALKDGDEIEVDADKGIVKIINKK